MNQARKQVSKRFPTDSGQRFHPFQSNLPQRGEDEDAHHEEEHEEAEFLVAVFQREGDRLQPRGVPRQLEDAHDPHDSEDLERPGACETCQCSAVFPLHSAGSAARVTQRRFIGPSDSVRVAD